VSSSLLRSEMYSSVIVLSCLHCPSSSIPKSCAVAVTGEPTLLETEVTLRVRSCGIAGPVSGVSYGGGGGYELFSAALRLRRPGATGRSVEGNCSDISLFSSCSAS
jgi:hypothetical protein